MATLHLAQEIFKLIYPVGSIYISDNATNPSSKFGGTWTRLSGGFLYGSSLTSGNTYSTGNGSGTSTGNHTLTIDQIPSHRHGITTWRNSSDVTYGLPAGAGRAFSNVATNGDGTSATENINFHGINYVGGGNGHSHNIPYIACSIWRRTA